MASQIVLALFGSVLLGLVLLVLGLRGRRINRHPVCSLCGFDLEGTYPQSITCPECGAGLRRRKGVRIGARRRMWIVASIGTLLILLPAGLLATLLYAVLTGADVNQYKPVGLLLWEGRRANPATAEAAVNELHSRIQNKQVAAHVVDRVVEVALDIQGDPAKPWLTAWGDIVETARVNGDVEDDAYQRFVEQAAVLEFIIRPQVRQGDPVPVEVKLVESRVGSASQLHVAAEWRNRTIDGDSARPREEPFVPTGGLGGLLAGFMGVSTPTSHAGYFNLSGPRGAWGGWNHGDCRGTLRMPADLAPGPHTAEVTITLQAQLPPRNAMGGMWTAMSTKPTAHADRAAVLPFTVTPAADQSVRLVNPSPEQAAALVEQLKTSVMLHVQELENAGPFGQSMNWGNMNFNIPDAPMDAAFTVKLRIGDKLTGPLGEVILRTPDPDEPASNNPYRFMTAQQAIAFQMPAGFKEDKVTVVLEPNRDAALKTVDVVEIYGQPIELEGVTVQRPDF